MVGSYTFLYFPKQTLSQSGLFEIKQGESFNQVCRNLVKHQHISACGPLKWYTKIHKDLRKIKFGVYKLEQSDTVLQLLTKLSSGKQFMFAVTLVEGKTLREWLATLKDVPQLKHDLQGLSYQGIANKLNIERDNPEGLFLPETYRFSKGTSESAILELAHNSLNLKLEELWQRRAEDLPLTDKYQALILASIIEKETAVANERPDISAVFINRLRMKMRLQTDPTVIYGIGETFNGNITKADLRRKTPYNTYRIKGLPPTPIAMPSEASIEAALNPSSADYIYFVSMGNGKHFFSKTLAEHNKAVRKYQLRNEN